MVENLTVLSPHLDDAVWSLGGYLSKKGDGVRVVNIFSKQAFVYGKVEDPECATKVRKEEDTLALNAAGITDIIYLDFPEALLRGYSFEQMFMEKAEGIQDPVEDELQTRLRTIVAEDDTILIPACFGGHVDHFFTRRVALKLPGIHYFYEDLPYAARSERREIAESFLRDKRRITYSPTVDGIREHAILIQMYKSQIADRHTNQIMKHVTERGFNLWI